MVRAYVMISVLLALFIGSREVAAVHETVAPAFCTVVPITSEQLTAIAAEPPDPGALAPEIDREVPAADVDAIRLTVRESVACTNANDMLAALALFTGRYLGERFSGDGMDDLGHLLAALSRAPSEADPADQLTLVSIEEPRVREDGSVTVTVITENAVNRFVDAVTLVSDEGRWLIDRVEPQEMSAATPVS